LPRAKKGKRLSPATAGDTYSLCQDHGRKSLFFPPLIVIRGRVPFIPAEVTGDRKLFASSLYKAPLRCFGCFEPTRLPFPGKTTRIARIRLEHAIEMRKPCKAQKENGFKAGNSEKWYGKKGAVPNTEPNK